jgi:proline racemase
VTVAVAGVAHWMGQGSFIIDPDDRLGHGFELPAAMVL